MLWFVFYIVVKNIGSIVNLQIVLLNINDPDIVCSDSSQYVCCLHVHGWMQVDFSKAVARFLVICSLGVIYD